MKVGMLSMKGNFDKSMGRGPQRYAYELYENVARLAKKKGVEVDKLELGFGNSGFSHKVSFTLATLSKGFYNYDIIHMPAPVMFNPPLTRARTVTTVHELVVVPKGHLFYEDERSFRDMINPSTVIGDFIKKQIFASDYLIAVSKQARQRWLIRRKAGREISGLCLLIRAR